MALNQIGDKIRDQVMKGVNGIFDANQRSPASKKARESGGPSASEGRPRSPSEVPFNSKQVTWLGNAVSNVQIASLQAFGEAVEARVQRGSVSVQQQVATREQVGLQQKFQLKFRRSEVSQRDIQHVLAKPAL